MAFKFPFTNYHELNLTWVLDKLKELFEETAENVSVIQNYDGRLTAVETELPTVSETASEASRAASAAGTLAQTAKATADTAQENAIQAQTLAGTARQEAQTAAQEAAAATQAAQQAQATAQNFDGRITQAENDSSQALEASRSFENRVQAAINTANNAASTATNAQGIATNANQNAAAALDRIGNLSALETVNKTTLVAAINEVLATGGKVQSVNGETGAVVLTSEDIDYNDTTVKNALDGKQNAPATAGTAGQVLGLNALLNPVWLNQSGGGGGGGGGAPEIVNNVLGDFIKFNDGANSYSLKSFNGNIISENGVNEINIFHSNTVNLLASAYYLGNYTINSNGIISGNTSYKMYILNVKHNSTYTIHKIGTSGYPCYQLSKTRPSAGSSIGGPITIRYTTNTTVQTEDNNYLIVSFANSNTQIQIEEGSFTTYVSSIGEKININLPVNISNGAFSIDNFGNVLITDSDTGNIYHDNINPINTYYGLNIFWIDTGDITALSYVADTKLYIDGKIAELQALVLENNG